MQRPPPQEEEFFRNIEAETPLEILVRRLTLSLAHIRREQLEILETGRFPDSMEKSQGRHFRACKDVENFYALFRGFTTMIVGLGPSGVPALLFAKLSPAVHWVLKGYRRFLRDIPPIDDPLVAIGEDFEAYKAICRPDTQPDGLTQETFMVEVWSIYHRLEQGGFRLATMLTSFEQQQCLRLEEALAAQAARNAGEADPKAGKGFSHSAHAGESYNGVKVEADQQHVMVGEDRLEITSAANWEVVDRIVEAHFRDATAKVTLKELKNFSTPDEKRFVKHLKRLQYPKGDPRRRGNHKYTGEVRLVAG